MSTLISGWIEIYDEPGLEEWAAVTDIGLIVEQSYNAYGCLFGVRNYSNFISIAPLRGLPLDISDVVKKETENPEYYHSPSWVGFKEIEMINWDDSVVDAYVRVYPQLANGEFASRYSCAYVADHPFDRQVGDTWYANGKEAHFYPNGELHKIERISYRDALRPFQAVFEIMAILAKHKGSDNVRLVVWFI